MQKTEYRCVGGCVGGWGNDSLVLTLDRQKKTTLSGTSTSTSTADDARPYEGLVCCDFFSSENMPSTSLCVKKEYYIVWEYSRTLHMGIQPYSSYGHTVLLFIWAYRLTLHMGIQPYSSYRYTAVLFLWAYRRTLHTNIQPYSSYIISYRYGQCHIAACRGR